MINTNPARGMRDFLPADIRRRNYVIGVIKEVYESYGFEPLETPSVENLETLTGKYGEEGNQLIYKILKRRDSIWEEIENFVELVNDKFYDDENPVYPPDIERQFTDLALRYDLTVPFSRVVANYKNDLPKYFKRYQIQPVWRADRPAKGRYREFYQCDVDAIGSKSMIVEAELISAVCEILERLGFDDFVVRLNHRALLAQIVEAAFIQNEKTTDALVALDKLDKIGSEGVQNELIERGIDKQNAELFTAMFEGFEGLEKNNQKKNKNGFDAFNQAFMNRWEEGYDKDDAEGKKVLKEIENLIRLIEKTNASKYVKIDPSLARGLSYYTGAIFEIVLTEGDFKGSIGGGGRYDGLIGMFGKEEIPACGFSLGLERIIVVMTERGMFPPELQTNSADVFITIWNEESISESLKLANEIRASGLRVTVYPETDKLAKQFKYASSINVPYVCVIGESELAEGKVTVKNLENGEQEAVDRSNIGQYLVNKKGLQ